MKQAVLVFLLKQIVKYLKNNPDLIPGTVDDALIKLLASALGV